MGDVRHVVLDEVETIQRIPSNMRGRSLDAAYLSGKSALKGLFSSNDFNGMRLTSSGTFYGIYSSGYKLRKVIQDSPRTFQVRTL